MPPEHFHKWALMHGGCLISKNAKWLSVLPRSDSGTFMTFN